MGSAEWKKLVSIGSTKMVFVCEHGLYLRILCPLVF